ncbi:MAG: hypothetical protein QXI27_05710 [Nitrososphaerota archaeon]
MGSSGSSGSRCERGYCHIETIPVYKSFEERVVYLIAPPPPPTGGAIFGAI